MPVQQVVETQRGYGQRLVAAAVLLACLYLASSLVMTVVVSLLLALLCDPGVTWLSRKGLPRGVGASLMVLLMVGVFYLMFYMFYAQAATFVNDFPKYSTKLRGHVLRFRQRAEELQKQTRTVIADDQPAPATSSASGGADLSAYLGAGLRSMTEVLFMASFVPFLVYFLLTWRDHIRRHSISLFGTGNRMAAEKTLDGITTMIRGFVVGNVIIAVILSVVSGLFFWRMGLPYAAVMGPVSGFLSVVPYLGVLLGSLPPLLAGVARYDTLAPLVAIVSAVVGLHIIALNVLYPKLVGSRVHLNPVVVTIALMFWGWLWGGMGLILAPLRPPHGRLACLKCHPKASEASRPPWPRLRPRLLTEAGGWQPGRRHRP